MYKRQLNDTAREDFNAQHPIGNQGEKNGRMREVPILLGQQDTDSEKLAVVLGVWKPINMNSPVCDHPLAIMDARTFNPDDERVLGVQVRLIEFSFQTLRFINDLVPFMFSQLVHRASQRWYYYSMQQTDEVLLFTHYTRGTRFATPHASFANPHCARGMETCLLYTSPSPRD